ncbi:AAA family ATPase [Halopseudomonas salegens]|uniref:DNA repair exonuclease SbcCD ATPase subunit n=1 Tax=Halopseudomonas salegens TaxID=1434072 RepID=A0A1H2H3H2_9GAMM|nr:AAA family ATPase [Halopseudomonas salegens]SDU26401.1 DNA repair exonuclease SbcCD ATPase subunit [Halopseudomonas salegens]
MQLIELEVNQFRQFRKPLRLTELQPGLNVIAGPNESGKSTLVRAIRAAFFERHGSSVVTDLQPWGDSSAAPEISLRFLWQGESWHLHKRFLKQKRCDLHIENQHWSGSEAEERLAALLGYEFPGKGVSKAEHWGIPGLLWIEQGSGHEISGAVSHASEHLQAALGDTLGELASSGGDRVVDAVTAQLAELQTKTGKPTGRYAQLVQTSREQAEKVAVLTERVAQYRSEVDQLGLLVQQQAADEQQQPWLEYRRRERETQQALDQVARLQQQQEQDLQLQEQCGNTLRLIREQIAGFKHQLEERERREQALANATANCQALEQHRQEAAADQQRAEQEHVVARAQLSQVREQVQRQQQASERAALQARLEQLQPQVETAMRCAADVADWQRRLQQSQLPGADLKQLRQSRITLDQVLARQQQAATRLEYDLSNGAVSLNGHTLQGKGAQALTQSAELDLGTLGRLRILPGGSDLGELMREQQRLQDEYALLCRQLGVSDLNAAEQRQEQAQLAERELASAQTRLAGLAPQGVAALEQELADCQQQLAALPELPTEAPRQLTDISLHQAESLFAAAEQQWRQAEQRCRDLQQQLLAAEREKTTAQAELSRLQTHIADLHSQQQEQGLTDQLRAQLDIAQTIQQRLSERAEQIAAARPDILRDDRLRFTRTAEQLEQAFAERKTVIVGLRSALQALNAEALEEQLAVARQAAEQSVQRLHEVERRVAALSLLKDLLAEQRQALTRRLQAPLQAHIQHYLRLLFPQADLLVDEQLQPRQLVRQQAGGAINDPLETLSYGAREQMGLISRLAYADLLQAAGRPTLIILDDALVHSDNQRLDDMKRILFDAARRHQILLFTCHADKWQDLGVPVRQMQQLTGGL